MELQELTKQTINIESAVLNLTQSNIEQKLPEIETDDEIIALTVHDYTGNPIQMVEIELQNQLDPSYQ